jgi:hypothetical protein
MIVYMAMTEQFPVVYDRHTLVDSSNDRQTMIRRIPHDSFLRSVA